MTSRIAGSVHFKRRSSARRKRQILIGLILVLIAAGALYYYMPHKSAGKSTAQAAPVQLSYNAKQAADASLLAGAVGQYAAANNALPTKLSVTPNGILVLCGSACDAVNYEVGAFNVYQSSNVKLVSYSAGLTAPNTQMMYMVPGAKCDSNGQLGAVNQTPRSMVILYAVTNATGVITPRCVVL